MPSKKKELKELKAKKSDSQKAPKRTKRTGKYAHLTHKEEKKSPRAGIRASGSGKASFERGQVALQESEERYHSLFSQARDGIVLIDLETGQIIDCNPEFENLTGRTLRQLEKMKIWELRSSGKVEKAKKKFFEVKEEGTGGSRELEFQKPNGDLVPIEFVSRVVRIGNQQYIQSLVRDITDRKRAEKALKETKNLLETLLDHTHMMVAYLDPQFNFVRVNRAYAKADEREPSFFPGKNHFDLYPNQENEEIFSHVVERGEPYFAYAKPFVYKEHPERGVTYWDWSLIPIKDLAGAVSGLVLTVVNVTERICMEESLRESEEKFRNLAEQSPNMIFINKKGKVVYANRECERIMGYKRKEFYLPDFDFFTLISPESVDLVKRSFSRHMKGEEVTPYEYTLVTKGGEKIQAIHTTKLIKYEGESAFLGIVTDITERKHAEEALQWELAVNIAIAKLSGALITPSSSLQDIANIVLDSAKRLTQSEHGYVSSIDPKTLDTIAHTLTRMMGKECSVEGEDRRIRFPIGADGLYPSLWGHALNTRKAFLTNAPHEHKVSRGVPGGHITIRNLLSVPAMIGEELVGQIALANSSKDYTHRELQAVKRLAELYAMAIQRKRAEETLKERTDQLNERVKELNCLYSTSNLIEKQDISIEEILQGTVELIPPAWQYPKITCARAVLGDLKFKTNNFQETIWKQASDIIVHGDPVGRLEVYYLEEKPERNGGPFLAEERSLINAVAERLGKIIERRRAEEKIQKLNRSLKAKTMELASANKELEAFSYSVSHDLRAPLRAIDGFSRALEEDYANKLDDPGKDYLKRVREATQHMRELIDDLLNLSLVMRAEMRREKVNLSEMVQAISVELQKNKPERRVEFVIQQNVIAYGDERLLHAVLENLLGNAWKFTQKHSKAKIEFGTIDKDGQMVYFVRDDGVGFDMTYANKLFIPFQRLHSTAEFSGSGIGLTTASRIINRHGGRIWAEGEVEKGAIFYFTL